MKLEITLQRQRNNLLEAKLAKAESFETENKTLQQSNKNLSSELEKRDLALQQAFDLICQLEAKKEHTPSVPATDHIDIVKAQPKREPTPGMLAIKQAMNHTDGTKVQEKHEAFSGKSPIIPAMNHTDRSEVQGSVSPKSTGSVRKLAAPSMLSLRTVSSFMSQDESTEEDDEAVYARDMEFLDKKNYLYFNPTELDLLPLGNTQQDGTAQQDAIATPKIDLPATPIKKPAPSDKLDTFTSRIERALTPEQPDAQDIPPTPPTKSTTYRKHPRLQPLERPVGPMVGPDVLPPTPESIRFSDDRSYDASVFVPGTNSSTHVLRRKKAFYEYDLVSD